MLPFTHAATANPMVNLLGFVPYPEMLWELLIRKHLNPEKILVERLSVKNLNRFVPVYVIQIYCYLNSTGLKLFT